MSRPAWHTWAIAIACSASALIYDPHAPAADPKRVGMLVLSVLALATILAQGRPLRVGWPGALWGGYVAWSGLSIVWGSVAAVDDLAVWVATFLGVVALEQLEPEERAAITGRAAWIIGSVASLWAVWQYARGARGIWVHAGQGNGNWLGLLMAMTIPLTIGWAGSQKGLLRWMGAAGACLQVAGIVVAHSRVAWMAVPVASAMVGLVWLGRRSLLIAGAVGAVILSLWTSPAMASPDQHEEQQLVDVDWRSALGGRKWIAGSCLEAAKESPLFGHGMGRFGHAYLEAQGKRLATWEPSAASRRFINATTAHNDWLQAAVEGGVAGLGLVLAAWVALMVGALRQRRWDMLTAAVALGLCACGDSPLRQPAACVVMAMMLASPGARWEIPRGHARLVGLVVLLFVGWLLSSSAKGWMADRWLFGVRGGEAEHGLRTLRRAVAVAPRSGEARLMLGIVELEEGNPASALKSLTASKPLLANVGTDVAIGNAWMAQGNAQMAWVSYERAIALHPGSFRGHANMVEALVVIGRLDEASHHLGVARDLWPGHPRLADLDERLRAARRARERDDGEQPSHLPDTQ